MRRRDPPDRGCRWRGAVSCPDHGGAQTMTQVAEPITERAAGATAATVPHWIGGRRVAGTSGRRGPVYNPATGALAREVDFASVEEVAAAVAAAKAAFPAWRA